MIPVRTTPREAFKKAQPLPELTAEPPARANAAKLFTRPFGGSANPLEPPLAIGANTCATGIRMKAAGMP